MKKTGGAPDTLRSTTEDPQSLAIGAGQLVWFEQNLSNPVNYGQILSMSVSGGTPQVIVPNSGLIGAGVAASDTHVAWDQPSISAKLWSSGSVQVLSPGADHPHIAIDSTHVYWPDGGIHRASLGGGPVTNVTTGDQNVFHIALGATDIVYYEKDGSSFDLKRVPKTGGTGVPLFISPGLLYLYETQGIVVSGSDVYFTEGVGDSVSRVSLSGGVPTILHNAAVPVGRVAVDANCVYFSEGNDIMMVAR